MKQLKNLISTALTIAALIPGLTLAAEKSFVELGNEIAKQEQQLTFDSFSNNDALALGLYMTNKAKQEQKAITIDITRNGQQLFHYALTGTAPENDIWISRKNVVTKRSNRSSLAMWYMQQEGWMENDFHMSYIEMWGLDAEQAMNLGGAFPLTISDVGVVGTITVSGLPHDQDHQFVVDAIKEYKQQM